MVIQCGDLFSGSPNLLKVIFFSDILTSGFGQIRFCNEQGFRVSPLRTVPAYLQPSAGIPIPQMWKNSEDEFGRMDMARRINL